MIRTRRSLNTGFTLMELMVVVVIVGVLAMISYPSYQSFIKKGNRAQAQAYLMNLAQMQQRYFGDSRTYAANATVLNAAEPARVIENYVVAFNTDNTAPPTFTITATPRVGTTQDGDGVLAIDNTGAKTLAGAAW